MKDTMLAVVKGKPEPIVFLIVAKNKARIRVIPSAAHSKEDLELGIRAFEKVAKELKVL